MAGNARLLLTWTAPAIGWDPTHYEVCHSRNAQKCHAYRTAGGRPDFGSEAVIETFDGINAESPRSTTDTLVHVVTGLTDGTAYGFNVQAFNGTSWSTVPTNVLTHTPQARPGAPTGVNPSSSGLSWTAPAGGAPTGYEYRVGHNTTRDASDWMSTTTTSVNIASLRKGIRHTYQVRSYKGSGTSRLHSMASAPVDFVPNVMPTSLTAAVGSSSGELDLSWTAPASGTQMLTGYEYCTGAAAGDCASAGADDWKATGGTTASHTVTGLTPNTTYYAQVRAVYYGQFKGLPATEASGTSSG